MKLGDAIGKLRKLKESLENVWTFYRANIDTYEAMAKSIAHGVLIALPPPDVEPDEWAKSVATVVERIGAFLVNSSAASGFILRLASTSASADGGSAFPPVPGMKNMGVQDIVRWVEAGRNKTSKDPDGGKNFDERDFGKSDSQIAFNIMYAIRQGRDNGIMAHIAQFIGAAHTGDAHDRSPQILAAWIDAIVPRVRADLEAWMRGLMAGI